MDKALFRLALFGAGLLTAGAQAQQAVGGAPQKDAVQTAMTQYNQDTKTAQTDRAAALQICQSPGPDCDAAKAKAKADDAKARGDKEALALAMRGPQNKPVNTHRTQAVLTLPGPATVSVAPENAQPTPTSWFSKIFHGSPNPAPAKTGAAPATTTPAAPPAAH
jgi:hypothetical protein